MIKFQDSVRIGDTRNTDDGYLVAMSRVARTGIQMYHASELGMLGDHLVSVMRPDNEVFALDAMSSLTHAPVTVNHPVSPVDAANWKDLAVGEVGEGVMRDGEWLAVPLIVKDQAGIKAAQETHKEISMGYTAEIVDAPSGANYDKVMTNIRFNHLALVKDGRAGSEARIGDAHNWGIAPTTTENVQMDIKTVVFGDQAVDVAAKDAGTVTQILKDHQTALDALNAKIEDRDTTIGELKAENADTSKKILGDAEIEALVRERTSVISKASKIVDGFNDAGKSVDEIRREAVKSMYGDEAAAKEVSDAEIKGIFRVMSLDDSARDVLGDRYGMGEEEDEEDNEMMMKNRKGKKKDRMMKNRKKMGDSWGAIIEDMKGN